MEEEIKNYVVQVIKGLGEFNVYSGTEEECRKEEKILKEKGAEVYISSNRYD